MGLLGLLRQQARPDTFPQTKRYAAELAGGTGHARFDFTIGLMINSLRTSTPPGPEGK